ncbi:macrolide ABC transporter ATP-binding protein [candidate division WOR-1 bacterium RIFOXYA2_FULL_36_21]|uniref:Macrolide ABC transporter ATP-binding protein n=1 Tax=candidate division WOR-1 bacterium RIFOXYB2_FULL_36_35 TaxID=1802578 RepID=A0A1F4S6X1_UNCSA|nr:MAG: macrolide ABC transporter ATP-binding protein [candidate division WOR-1 bacterium RIFOXYA2_FULL_36_21]OGC14514.1 MAG: macrolide ABC transporter ATP-binding protein [candidate division WOR-1 bacterium RIFOXYA12_FULL_36_13]OGC15493.1 MAG: macrolide ABC transporter ATP-binding protein [candidate division WOR-1 bacterium RIFOXYB2_FULL_36_35]
MNKGHTLQIENIKKIYTLGEVDVPALNGVSINIDKGEFVSIMGPSGCGKSTLMNMIGCLDKPTSGKIILDNINTENLNDDELAKVRNEKIGFVFQMFNLLPRLTAIENIELPMIYAGKNNEERIKHSKKILEDVGLKDRANHYPKEMSGGQMQRVAIARALINNPAIILADEPTGNLDSKSSVEIIKILQNLNNQGTTIILVTHEPDIASYTKRKIVLKDGLLLEDQKLNQINIL